MKNMNNKKGFTLVELLAVISVLAIIISIAVPASIAISNRSKRKMHNTKVEMIEKAAALYAQDNPGDVSNEVSDNCEIKVGSLIDKGYLKKDDKTKGIVDPETGESMNDYCIDLKKENNRYTAEMAKNMGGSITNVYGYDSDDEDVAVRPSPPIYNGTPAISDQDDDSNLFLNSITIGRRDTASHIPISPTFNKNITRYTVEVPYDEYYSILATAPSDVTVTVSENTPFIRVSELPKDISITLSKGTKTKVYTVRFKIKTQQSSSDTDLDDDSNLFLNSITIGRRDTASHIPISPTFNKNITSYTVEVPYDEYYSISATAPSDVNVSISDSSPYIRVSTLPMNIYITISKGSHTKTYTVKFQASSSSSS